jgi:hypothetical protein
MHQITSPSQREREISAQLYVGRTIRTTDNRRGVVLAASVRAATIALWVDGNLGDLFTTDTEHATLTAGEEAISAAEDYYHRLG